MKSHEVARDCAAKAREAAEAMRRMADAFDDAADALRELEAKGLQSPVPAGQFEQLRPAIAKITEFAMQIVESNEQNLVPLLRQS